MKKPISSIEWAIYFLLNITDLLYLIFFFDTSIEELNPIVKKIMEMGIISVVFYKSFSVLLCYFIICYASGKQDSGLGTDKSLRRVFYGILLALVFVNLLCFSHFWTRIDEQDRIKESNESKEYY